MSLEDKYDFAGFRTRESASSCAEKHDGFVLERRTGSGPVAAVPSDAEHSKSTHPPSEHELGQLREKVGDRGREVRYVRFESNSGEYGAQVPLDAEWDLEPHDDHFKVSFNPEDDVSDMRSWYDTSGREGAYVSSVELLYGSPTRTFVEYLSEEVFYRGSYNIEETERYGDVRVAEFSDGKGFVVSSDMERAVEDANVDFVTVKDGWLHLTDER